MRNNDEDTIHDSEEESEVYEPGNIEVVYENGESLFLQTETKGLQVGAIAKKILREAQDDGIVSTEALTQRLVSALAGHGTAGVSFSPLETENPKVVINLGEGKVGVPGYLESDINTFTRLFSNADMLAHFFPERRAKRGRKPKAA